MLMILNSLYQGIHGEGGTFSTLFSLYFWDIIFLDDIPDTFLNPFQSGPLDYYTDEFYSNRKTHIKTRLDLISEASNDVRYR